MDIKKYERINFNFASDRMPNEKKKDFLKASIKLIAT